MFITTKWPTLASRKLLQPWRFNLKFFKMKTIFQNFLILTLFIAVFSACNKDQHESDDQPQAQANNVDLPGMTFQFDDAELQRILRNNPEATDRAAIPPATIPLVNYPPAANTSVDTRAACAQALSPAAFAATLKPGQSVSESKTACLDGAPPKGDVLFCFDLTGSMGSILNNVKVNSVNIMNAVSASISDSHFGLISHEDYPGFHSSCGYSAAYGAASDLPFHLNQPITSSAANVQTAINLLSLGNGADGPESYERALFEAYSNPGIGWRTGAARIVVAFLDNIPHDCDLGTGSSPGPNGVIGGGDDIDMDAVIAQFAANNIKLIVVSGTGGGVLTIWDGYASATGGQAVQLGAGNIADLVADLIEESVSNIASLTLQVAQPAFAPWLSSVVPAAYNNVMLDQQQTLGFGVTFTVPLGTPDGVYHFNVNLVGDGAVYGTQTVAITVLTDSDGDGCANDVDPHPNSNKAPTVVIGGCNSNVPNLFVTQCSTMSDLIADCAANATNHGQFVSCVAALTNAWKAAGLITGAQKGKIMACAAQANIP
jgi:hypothetical protein